MLLITRNMLLQQSCPFNIFRNIEISILFLHRIYLHACFTTYIFYIFYSKSTKCSAAIDIFALHTKVKGFENILREKKILKLRALTHTHTRTHTHKDTYFES